MRKERVKERAHGGDAAGGGVETDRQCSESQQRKLGHARAGLYCGTGGARPGQGCVCVCVCVSGRSPCGGNGRMRRGPPQA